MVVRKRARVTGSDVTSGGGSGTPTTASIDWGPDFGGEDGDNFIARVLLGIDDLNYTGALTSNAAVALVGVDQTPGNLPLIANVGADFAAFDPTYALGGTNLASNALVDLDSFDPTYTGLPLTTNIIVDLASVDLTGTLIGQAGVDLASVDPQGTLIANVGAQMTAFNPTYTGLPLQANILVDLADINPTGTLITNALLDLVSTDLTGSTTAQPALDRLEFDTTEVVASEDAWVEATGSCSDDTNKDNDELQTQSGTELTNQDAYVQFDLSNFAEEEGTGDFSNDDSSGNGHTLARDGSPGLRAENKAKYDEGADMDGTDDRLNELDDALETTTDLAVTMVLDVDDFDTRSMLTQQTEDADNGAIHHEFALKTDGTIRYNDQADFASPGQTTGSVSTGYVGIILLRTNDLNGNDVRVKAVDGNGNQVFDETIITDRSEPGSDGTAETSFGGDAPNRTLGNPFDGGIHEIRYWTGNLPSMDTLTDIVDPVTRGTSGFEGELEGNEEAVWFLDEVTTITNAPTVTGAELRLQIDSLPSDGTTEFDLADIADADEGWEEEAIICSNRPSPSSVLQSTATFTSLGIKTVTLNSSWRTRIENRLGRDSLTFVVQQGTGGQSILRSKDEDWNFDPRIDGGTLFYENTDSLTSASAIGKGRESPAPKFKHGIDFPDSIGEHVEVGFDGYSAANSALAFIGVFNIDSVGSNTRALFTHFDETGTSYMELRVTTGQKVQYDDAGGSAIESTNTIEKGFHSFIVRRTNNGDGTGDIRVKGFDLVGNVTVDFTQTGRTLPGGDGTVESGFAVNRTDTSQILDGALYESRLWGDSTTIPSLSTLESIADPTVRNDAGFESELVGDEDAAWFIGDEPAREGPALRLTLEQNP